jgi:bifunctional DNase/RNase
MEDEDKDPEQDPRDYIYGAEQENRQPRNLQEKEVEVIGVFEPADQPSGTQAFVALRDKLGRTIQIWIGLFEATSISVALRKEGLVRPLTHDLIKSLLERLNVIVDRVIIDDLWQSTFYAKLSLRRDGESMEIDCRPSDGIALGLRYNAPIWVAEDVLAEAHVRDENGNPYFPDPGDSPDEGEEGDEDEPDEGGEEDQ